MKKFLSVIFFFSVFSGLQGASNPVHDLQFSEEEIAAHKNRIDRLVKTAAQCLDETYAEHLRFFKKHGVSKFYGDRNSRHKTRAERIQELKRFGAPASLVGELEAISCIGLTLNCLEQGFEATEQSETWKKIDDFLQIDQKVYGTDLQILLQKLGWKLLYWNPHPRSNHKWDLEDRRLNPLKPGKSWNPVWGDHANRYKSVMNRGIYYQAQVNEISSLVGFADRAPLRLKNAPFFVGIAHAGYHVFPGRAGEVIEAHSTRALNSIDNLEKSVFNPLASGGGPRWTRTERYRSGLIAVPPGY